MNWMMDMSMRDWTPSRSCFTGEYVRELSRKLNNFLKSGSEDIDTQPACY